MSLAPGSGVWYQLGRTIAFSDRAAACAHFKLPQHVCKGWGIPLGRVFPEDLLYIIPRKHNLTIDAKPLGATAPVMRGQDRSTFGKTQLFPGGTWHAHNATAVASYLSDLENDVSPAFNPSYWRHYLAAMAA